MPAHLIPVHLLNSRANPSLLFSSPLSTTPHPFLNSLSPASSAHCFSHHSPPPPPPSIVLPCSTVVTKRHHCRFVLLFVPPPAARCGGAAGGVGAPLPGGKRSFAVDTLEGGTKAQSGWAAFVIYLFMSSLHPFSIASPPTPTQ